MLIASLLGLAAFALGGCVEDGEQRHVGQTCYKVVYSACLTTGHHALIGENVTCALIAAESSEHFLRLDALSEFPIIEGDEWCGQWKDVRP